MAEPTTAAPQVKGYFESFVDLIDVVTDWSFLVLVVLIIFRRQIGEHLSTLIKELANLVSRLQSAKVGGTTLVFSRGDLKIFAADHDPKTLRSILLNMPESIETGEIAEEETAEETESELSELEATLAQYIKSRSDQENDP